MSLIASIRVLSRWRYTLFGRFCIIQLHGLIRPRASRSAVKACRSFAMTDSNSEKGMPRHVLVAPRIHWWRIVSSDALFASSSHSVLLMPSKSNPSRHFVVSNVPSPFHSFFADTGSMVSSSFGGKTSWMPWSIPRATCSTCCLVVGMMHEIKSST